jgi:cytochrome c556
MTYVAQYFHAFSQMDQLGNAVRRVGQFGQVMESVWKLENDYEARVRKLMADVATIQASWTESVFDGYTDARRQLQEFDTYKNTTVC